MYQPEWEFPFELKPPEPKACQSLPKPLLPKGPPRGKTPNKSLLAQILPKPPFKTFPEKIIKWEMERRFENPFLPGKGESFNPKAKLDQMNPSFPGVLIPCQPKKNFPFG